MRFLLIVLIAFYFTGCGRVFKSKDKHSSDKKHVDQTDSDITEGTEEDSAVPESSFTITHKATDVEKAYIYLSTSLENPSTRLESNARNINYIYNLRPLECVKIRESQFANLKVEFEEGGLSDYVDFACGSASSICRPGHYEIINLGVSWYNADRFTLQPVKQPNTSQSCMEIEKWMEEKKSSQQQQTTQSPSKTETATPHTFIPAP